MTKTQVEVITSVQRRRRWSRAERERIVAAAIEPGAVASEVARQRIVSERRNHRSQKPSTGLCEICHKQTRRTAYSVRVDDAGDGIGCNGMSVLVPMAIGVEV